MEIQAGRSVVLGHDLPAIDLTTLQSKRAAERVILSAALVVSDSLAICAAFGLAYIIRFKSTWSIFYEHSTSTLDFYSSLVFWLVPLIVILFAFYQLYAPRQIFDTPREYARVISASTTSMLLVVLLSFLLDDELVISRGWLVISWAALILCVGGLRFLARRVVWALRGRGYIDRRVAVVAAGDDLRELTTQLLEMPASGLNVIAAIDPAEFGEPANANSNGFPLRSMIQERGLEEIIVSSASVPQQTLARIVRELSQMPTELHIVPGMYEIQTTGVQVRDIRGLPLVTMNKVRITGLDFILKRTMDYLVAGGLLLLLSPILIAIGIAVRLTSPGPVFHRRRVLGERGKRFDALKFRTMYVDGDRILEQRPDLATHLHQNGKLFDDPRVTPVGRFLRRWSLDEFPQLINVLRGQMSLVGPRMITEAELSKFGHWQDNLITVKPGITGLWQVSGRSNLGYDDRVRLDMYYIRSYSIWRDIEILFRTIPAVFHGTGAY